MPRFVATIELNYDGPVHPHSVSSLLANALEHCRQENMLSDPEDDQVSCGWVDVTQVEHTP